MMGWMCKKCKRGYVPLFSGFPAPNECDCGGKEFEQFHIPEHHAHCRYCGKTGPMYIVEKRQNTKDGDIEVEHYYLMCSNCSQYFNWDVPIPIKDDHISVL